MNKPERTNKAPVGAASGQRRRGGLPNRVGNYGKGVPHDELGHVNFAAWVHAVSGDEPYDLEAIGQGGPVGLTNPQAAFTYSLVGADSHHLTLRRHHRSPARRRRRR